MNTTQTATTYGVYLRLLTGNVPAKPRSEHDTYGAAYAEAERLSAETGRTWIVQ